MSSFKFSKFGDWTKAGIILQNLPKQITPAFQAQLREDGELIKEKIIGHIDSQDLSWTPLSPKTVAIKGSDDIYVETGTLRDNITVRKVRAPKNGLTLFIGASPWTKNDDGTKLSDIMIWLEYGTSDIPARPLIRPTWNEVKPIIEKHWKEVLKDLIETGGRVV